MSQPYIFDGERVILPTGNDPAVQRVVGHLRYIVAADLGSATDPTGITIIEDRQMPQWMDTVQKLTPRQRTCVFADRLREHRYTEVVEYLRSLLGRPPIAGRWRLAIDASGVGRGVSDLLHEAQLSHIAVQMVAGTSVRQAGRFHNVAKQVLITELATALESGGLRLSADLPLRNELMVELESFQTRLSASGIQVIDGGGSNHHADMATALAIGLFASDIGNGYVGQGKLENFY